MTRALFAGRPLCAATMVWKPASPSPGIDDWTSTTPSVEVRISSAWMVRSSTASELVPAGGATVTARIFSEPALMNVVGNSGARTPVTRNSVMATASVPHFVQRLRSTPLMLGV